MILLTELLYKSLGLKSMGLSYSLRDVAIRFKPMKLSLKNVRRLILTLCKMKFHVPSCTFTNLNRGTKIFAFL